MQISPSSEKLKALCEEIAAECEARMESEGKLGDKQVAEWLLRHKRAAVIGALSDLVNQAMERRNDDDMVKRLLRAIPELEERAFPMDLLSQAVGIPLSYLLQLDNETSKACFTADLLIRRLRIEAKQAALEGMEGTVERLRPILDSHPDMTIAEALQELHRQTNNTIRRLDAGEGL